MLKYISQFSCWHMGPEVFYVIASETVSKTVLHLLVDRKGKERSILEADNIDLGKLIYPVKFVGLPAIVRARVRSALADAVSRELNLQNAILPYCEGGSDS